MGRVEGDGVAWRGVAIFFLIFQPSLVLGCSQSSGVGLVDKGRVGE